jgi:hypothetical protein
VCVCVCVCGLASFSKRNAFEIPVCCCGHQLFLFKQLAFVVAGFGAGDGPRASHTLCICSTTELHTQTKFVYSVQ